MGKKPPWSPGIGVGLKILGWKLDASSMVLFSQSHFQVSLGDGGFYFIKEKMVVTASFFSPSAATAAAGSFVNSIF